MSNSETIPSPFQTNSHFFLLVLGPGELAFSCLLAAAPLENGVHGVRREVPHQGEGDDSFQVVCVSTRADVCSGPYSHEGRMEAEGKKGKQRETSIETD